MTDMPRAARENEEKPKKKGIFRKFFGWSWSVTKKTAMVLGFLVLFWMVVMIIALSQLQPTEKTLPDQFIAYWEIDGGYADVPEESTFPGAMKSRPTIYKLINGIDSAAEDPRVKAMLVHFRTGGIGLAHIEELHAAIKRFRETGKPAIFFAADMPEGLGAYYFASVFDEILMQPVGTLMLGGINLEAPYFKELMDKLGVTAEFVRRKEYKTLYESVTAQEMSPENREMVSAMIESLAGTIVEDISETRGMTQAQVKAGIDMGLLTDQEALDSGLVDQIAYGDIVLDKLHEKLGLDPESEELPLVKMHSYVSHLAGKGVPGLMALAAQEVEAEKAPETRVALVFLSGLIVPDEAPGFAGGGDVASAREIGQIIYRAGMDDSVSVVVLRIDSPGGSPSASETIRRAIVKTQERGTPVYVSMGQTAASGGYWVAAPADRIFALPTTITGSIGVVSGKPVLKEMWNKIGVNWEEIEWGENADIWSVNEPFSPSGRERINALADHIYNHFIRVVSDGRGMSPQEVEQVARGYVWPGRQALDAGLVDELGGLDVALDHVAVTLGKESRDDLNIVLLPKPKTPVEKLLELLETQAAIGETLKIQATLVSELAPFLRVFQSARQGGPVQAVGPAHEIK